MFLSLPPRDTPKASSRKKTPCSPSSPLLLPSRASTPPSSPVSQLEQPFKRFSFTGPPTPMEDGTNRKSAVEEEGEDAVKKELVFE